MQIIDHFDFIKLAQRQMEKEKQHKSAPFFFSVFFSPHVCFSLDHSFTVFRSVNRKTNKLRTLSQRPTKQKKQMPQNSTRMCVNPRHASKVSLLRKSLFLFPNPIPPQRRSCGDGQKANEKGEEVQKRNRKQLLCERVLPTLCFLKTATVR